MTSWGGTDIFIYSFIDAPGETLQFSTESSSSFTYIGIEPLQVSDHTIRDGAREKYRGGVDKKMPTRNCCATQECEVSK